MPMRIDTILRSLVQLSSLALLAGCIADFSDAATRLASDIEAGARLEFGEQFFDAGKRTRMDCDRLGVQIEKTRQQHLHARFVDAPQTYILEKPAGATLTIDIERRGGRAVVTDVR